MSTTTIFEGALAGAPQVGLDRRRLVIVVAPHPDDEVIGFGGALFDHVHAGGEALVLSLTDGEAYDPGASSASRHAAAATRRTEQLEALEVLGIEPLAVVRLGLPDGGVAGRVAEVVDELEDLLGSLTTHRVPLVVAPWRFDGHPDHEAAAQAVLRCVGCEIIEVPIWSWHHRHARPLPWDQLSVIPLSGAAQDAKRTALRQHRSQLEELSDGAKPILSPAFLHDFDRSFEVLVR